MSTPAPTDGPRTYGFTVRPAGNPDLTDELCDRLFEAGCDDASPGVTAGVTDIPFDRRAASLEEAVRSAVAQVRSAGLQVEMIVLDRHDIDRLLAAPERPVTAGTPPAEPAPAALAAAA